MEKLYNYLFHYSHLTGEWAAFPRDLREKYFNNRDRSKESGIIYSKDIKSLIEFLTVK